MFTAINLKQVLDKAKNGEELDITSLAPPDSSILKYEESSLGEVSLVTKVTAKVDRKIVPTITLSLYDKGDLIDSRLFFEHEQKELITTLQSWFI